MAMSKADKTHQEKSSHFLRYIKTIPTPHVASIY